MALATVHAPLQRERSPFTVKLAAERDILTLLRHLTIKPLTMKDLRRELLGTYSEFQIQAAILSLLETARIETVYPCGFELGFRATERQK